MNEVALCSERGRNSQNLLALLEQDCSVRSFDFDRLHEHRPALYNIFDIGLKDPARLLTLKQWLADKPKGSKAVFVLERGAHLEVIRANAVGATEVVHRPVDRQELMAGLFGGLGALHRNGASAAFDKSSGVGAAVDALQSVFAAVCAGAELDAGSIEQAGQKIVQQIGADGLDRWLETVRKHHSQTYQHCLLVTGVAVAFGRHLGCSEADQNRLALAGILHDVGKAKVPLAILEKPSPLDSEEMAVMRQHPKWGAEALADARGLPPDMVDIVLHHHEYLDGSGYPHGLKGAQISDLLRLVTIADVFGALIERRAYKPPIPSAAAYKTLVEMGPKLDGDLVREFRAVAEVAEAKAANFA